MAKSQSSVIFENKREALSILLLLFRYDIIYIKVRHKWFRRQTSLLVFKIEETV